MTNPFLEIDARLSNIETLLLDLKHKPNDLQDSISLQKLLTVNEASEFLNLSVPTIYTKVSKREIPFMKRGKRLYFSTMELLEYIKGGRINTNDEVKENALKFLGSQKKGSDNGK